MWDHAWHKGKTVIRLALICSLVYYFAGGWSFSFAGNRDARALPVSNDKNENGMGGGPAPELVNFEFVEVSDGSEISGVQEPAEFSKPQTLLFSSYKAVKGDMLGPLAVGFGLNEDTLLSVNKIRNSRLIQIGQVLKVPNQDGILHTIKKDETIASIAEKYTVDPEAIKTANELFSDALEANSSIFIPGARLGWVEKQEINGDLFIWPLGAYGYVTSRYGYRENPFGGPRQFHSGLDIGAPMGYPIKAAMAGRIIAVGNNATFGNYVVISHHSGYRTLYGHMSLVRVKAGETVGAGTRIGDVGSTGLSTGPHLHFTVYKNGVTVNPSSLMK
jgi:murein DD-endopeptidase MepM/ murein hydrolase activator NlpD